MNLREKSALTGQKNRKLFFFAAIDNIFENIHQKLQSLICNASVDTKPKRGDCQVITGRPNGYRTLAFFECLTGIVYLKI